MPYQHIEGRPEAYKRKGAPWTAYFIMHPLSTDLTNNIRSRLLSGESTRTISSALGISNATVSRVRSQFLPDLPLPTPGRPKKLTCREVRSAILIVTSGKADTAPQVARALQKITNKPISCSTVRRELKKAGLKAVVKQKRPQLLQRHRIARLDWARAHEGWTLEDWKRVVWSDETKINRLGSDGRNWAWKKRGEGLNDRLVTGTQKFGGGSIMVWGCMLWDGPGFAVKVAGRMDAELYSKILEEDLAASLEYYGKKESDVVFQQDNDPKHTSRRAQETLKALGHEVMVWPAQSPDLNPIEHLWSHLKKELAKHPEPPASIHELWERIEAEWNMITPAICQNLIESMPRRVSAVLKAKGGYTKY